MVFSQINNSASNLVFRAEIDVMSDAIKKIIRNNDSDSLMGLQSFAITMVNNNSLTNGVGIVSKIVFDTMKTYRDMKPMPKILMRTIMDSFKGRFKHSKMVEIFDGLEQEGFIIKSYVGVSKKDKGTAPDYTFIELTSLWKKYLSSYKQLSRQNMLYTENMGRLIWASILAKRGEPCGIQSFKILIIILHNVSKSGELSIKECEDYCNKIGKGVFAQLYSRNGMFNEDIKFFDFFGSDKVKVNKNTYNVYLKYIVPLSQAVIQTKLNKLYPHP